jgi:hypothetical protein
MWQAIEMMTSISKSKCIVEVEKRFTNFGFKIHNIGENDNDF